MRKISLFAILALYLSSCALHGNTKKDSGIIKYITGATKVDATKDVHVINVIRSIGVPKSYVFIGNYKYYQWEYSRAIGVSTFLGGGTTTFYCNLAAETKNNKVQLLNWYGNQCDIFLDQINEYFKNKLNIEIIKDEDIKQQQMMTTSDIMNQTYPAKASANQKTEEKNDNKDNKTEAKEKNDKEKNDSDNKSVETANTAKATIVQQSQTSTPADKKE